MTEKKIAVSQIVLTIGARELKLSVDEAKRLKQALEEVFRTESTWTYPYIPSYPICPPVISYSCTSENPTSNYLRIVNGGI